jgi:integrase
MKGHLKERSPGHWAIILDIKKDGARKRKWHSFKGTKREAQIECARLIAAMDEGAYVEKNKVTVKHFLKGRLAAWEAAKRITPKSVERYQELVSNQIVPHLGDKLLQKLTVQDIENWHGTLISSGRKDGKAGVCARTISHCHRLLTRMLKEAQRFDLITKNAAVASESLPKVHQEEVQIVRQDQLPVLLEKIKGHKIEPIALLALFCGLRRGEILALRWGNVDLDRSVLRVRYSLEETRAGGLRFKTPKSRAGARDVTMPDIVVGALRRHRIDQLELRAKLGLGRLSDDDLVFHDQISGRPIGPRHFSANVWPAAARSIGMPEITFHALRHTHASQLIAAGLDVVTISKRLGHSNPTITLSTYAHMFSNDDSKAARAINEAIAKIR